MELEHQLCNLSERLTKCLYVFSELGECADAQQRRAPRRPAQDVEVRLGASSVAQLLADYEAGWSLKLVAERYGVSKAAVLRVLKSHGVSTRKSGVNYVYLPSGVQRRDD